MIRKAIKSISFSQWGIVFIAVIMLVVSSNLNWGKQEYWSRIIKTDGKGYYAYLPAVFIYRDLNFSFYESMDQGKYKDEYNFFDYRIKYKGTYINKYYVGTALAQLPFFMAGHITTKFTHGETDGYSKWYQISINIAAVFWLLVGLVYLDKILVLYDVNSWERLLVLLAAVFGTNAFYYTLVEPAMSHIYSFAFVSWFVYLSKKYLMGGKQSHLIPIAIIFGMIVLIRPVNGLVVFIWPFLAEDIFALKNAIWNFFKRPIILFSALVSFLLVIGIQLVLYKISIGDFWVYSYDHEGFNFKKPHIIDILFSYKKGLFLYTPMLFISLSGLYFIWKESRFQAWTWLAFFVFITYVLSSWWIWYYGGSFSGRVFLEFVPLFMILLGIAFREIPIGWRKNIFVSIVLLLIVVCQIQTYQYRYYQIHWSDMTKEKYWDVFLRPDKI